MNLNEMFPSNYLSKDDFLREAVARLQLLLLLERPRFGQRLSMAVPARNQPCQSKKEKIPAENRFAYRRFLSSRCS